MQTTFWRLHLSAQVLPQTDYTVKGARVLLSDANETEREMMSEQGVITWAKGGQIDWASIGESLTPAERKRVMDIVNSGALR